MRAVAPTVRSGRSGAYSGRASSSAPGKRRIVAPRPSQARSTWRRASSVLDPARVVPPSPTTCGARVTARAPPPPSGAGCRGSAGSRALRALIHDLLVALRIGEHGERVARTLRRWAEQRHVVALEALQGGLDAV